MSTDAHNSRPAGNGPVHQDVAFDRRDVQSRSVLKFLLFLALTVVAVFLVCWWVLHTNLSHIAYFDAPPTPVRLGIAQPLPPEPRLQGLPGHPTDPQQDLRDKLAADHAALAEIRWVDEHAGIAQISVEDAMKIIVEKGLPARPVKPAGEKKP